jgi:DNA polymerase III subunit epsilon
MSLTDYGYVVIDCETTGFHPSAHHRIIELALVPIDEHGVHGEVWCSLFNPARDLGPTAIHEIRGRDLENAPRFEDVLGEVIDRLAGRVVVAHNARFDCAFLEYELGRAGIDVAPLAAVCTMQVAGLLGVAGTRARLRDCCAAIGYPHYDDHTAEGDALACAAIFDAFLPGLSERAVADLADLGCPPPKPASEWPVDERRASCKRRGERVIGGREPTFLATLVQAAEPPPWADAMQVAPYLDVLDRALEDRRLSKEEQDDLAATAQMLGLSASRVRDLHADYVGTLVTLAYKDGVVTTRERADLDLVAEALGVAGVEDALARLHSTSPSNAESAGFSTFAGKTVCFTGELCCEYQGTPISRVLAEQLARDAGMVVVPRVTKALDLLVVADPHSMSGKARKAREYGTRIIAETAFGR